MIVETNKQTKPTHQPNHRMKVDGIATKDTK